MADLDSLLTTAKNIVTALSTQSQILLQINGLQSVSGIAAPALLKNGAGRVASISVTAAASTVGHVYDSGSISGAANVLYTIPATVGIVTVNMPVTFGIVVSPGTGMTVAASFS